MRTYIAAIALLLIYQRVAALLENSNSNYCTGWSREYEAPVQKEMREFPCGGGYCKCYGNSADCSGHSGSLHFVPKLPRVVKCLNFSHNGIKVIDRDDFFANVSGLTSLDFRDNGLYSIIRGAFTVFRHLTHLNIGHNNLTFSALRPVLSVSTLEVLDIGKGDLKSLPAGIFSKYRLSKLKYLSLDSNYFRSVNLADFAPLTSLFGLNLFGNRMSCGIIAGFLPGLNKLELGNNGLFDFPETCRGNTSFYPHLTILNLKDNLLKTIPAKVCLESLELLELSDNLFSNLVTDMFNAQKFPALTSLFLGYTWAHINNIQPYAFRHPRLRTLSLLSDKIYFNGEKRFSAKSFSGVPNLRRLHLSNNHYENIDDSRFLRLLGDLSHLNMLSFCCATFSKLTTKTFTLLTSLEYLNLAENSIAHIPDGAFDMLVNLSTLVLGSNQISVVRVSTFSLTLFHRLQKLDLSGNPFQCNCNLRWFRGQLKEKPSVFSSKWANYVCTNLPNTSVQSFFVSDQSCFFSRETNGMIVAITSFVVIVFTSFSIFYRYRWHIRLLLYEALRGSGERLRYFQGHHFHYDVFVSYASEDLPWVRAHLLPELEGRLGLRLCIHERDFIPGENIVDNIVNFVRASKKVMMLFSMDFVRSHWCQFELNYCLRHVMEHDDMLLVLSLYPIPSRHLTPAMMAVMKITTYIQWAHDPDAIESFWRRIHIALNEVMP